MFSFRKMTKTEDRSGGSYSDSILASLEASTTSRAADAAKSAAVEAVAGLLSRSLAGALVEAPPWATRALSPGHLGMIGRELIRVGEHVSVIDLDADGELVLLPSSSWHWNGTIEEDGWRCTATITGPSSSVTRTVGRDSVVFLRWGHLSAEPHYGRAPHRLASLTAKAASESEKALGDEASGAIAQILTGPEGQDKAVYAEIKRDIQAARGRSLVLESTAGGFSDRAGAPHRDWMAARLGANPPAALVQLAKETFSRMVAAAGASPSLFDSSDGTAQREALRRWHLGTVLPVARLIEVELSARLDAKVRLKFDSYPLDMQARAASIKRLVDSGMDLDKAAGIVGLLLD